MKPRPLYQRDGLELNSFFGFFELFSRESDGALKDEGFDGAGLSFDALNADDAVGVDAELDFDTGFSCGHFGDV